MSHDEAGKPRPPVSWATIDRVADRHEREEMELLLAKSDEELDAELKEAGFAPDDAANVLQAALERVAVAVPAAAPKPAEVVSLAAERQKRGRGVGWLALVAAAVAVLVVGGGGAAIVALRMPDSVPATTTDPTPPHPQPEVLAKQEAEGLRQRAAAECGARKWGPCFADLTTAADLDPAGDEASVVRRLRGKAARGLGAEQTEAKIGPLTARSLLPEVRKPLAEALAPRAGQPVRVVCARGPEPEQFCGQLVAALTKAGWVVTREQPARDAGVSYGLAITVAEGSDEATEDAAEALADRLEWAGVRARGPEDVPGRGAEGPAVTLTVGDR